MNKNLENNNKKVSKVWKWLLATLNWKIKYKNHTNKQYSCIKFCDIKTEQNTWRPLIKHFQKSDTLEKETMQWSYCWLTLFLLLSGLSHLGRKWAASIKRNSPSLSDTLRFGRKSKQKIKLIKILWSNIYHYSCMYKTFTVHKLEQCMSVVGIWACLLHRLFLFFTLCKGWSSDWEWAGRRKLELVASEKHKCREDSLCPSSLITCNYYIFLLLRGRRGKSRQDLSH